jgi:peptidoglycan/LPS O-acetylase OafA/YrhL
MPNLFLEMARGLAALWVFAFHLMPLIVESSPRGAQFAAHGYFGVPLFFVISGYCLYSAAASNVRSGRTPWDFLKRRARRIFPPYWLSIVALLALPYVIEAISAIKTGALVLPEPAWLGLGTLDWLQFATLTRVFTAQGNDLQGVFTIVNAVYWTLAIEFQFYLVMVAVLFFPRWWKQWLIVVCAVSLLPGTDAIPGLFLPYWPSFFVGLALRWVHERGISADRWFGQQTVGIACALLAVLVAAGVLAVYHPGLAAGLAGVHDQAAMLGFALYAAAILWLGGGIEQQLAGTGAGGAAGRWLMRPFLLLGASSYSLYLLHGKLFHLPELFIRQLVSPQNSLYPILTMTSTAVLCYLFYLLCEKPFMSQRYQRRLEEKLTDHTGAPQDAQPAGADRVHNSKA